MLYKSLITGLFLWTTVASVVGRSTPVVDIAAATSVPLSTQSGKVVALPWCHDQRNLRMGVASWYAGPMFHQTANGEQFEPDRLAAASRSLPFNTRVRVTNLRNGRSVIVRINDRGPYIPGRVIDLTPKAAAK